MGGRPSRLKPGLQGCRQPVHMLDCRRTGIDRTAAPP